MSYGGLTRANHSENEMDQEKLLKGVNFFTTFNHAEREQLLRTNGKGLTIMELHDIFLGTYRGIFSHKHGKIVKPNYEANANMLVGLFMQGWEFQTLLTYLSRLNSNGLTISKTGSLLDAVELTEVTR